MGINFKLAFYVYMLYRTTILLPEKLKERVEYRAKLSDVSLGEFIRKSLEQTLNNKDSNNLKMIRLSFLTLKL